MYKSTLKKKSSINIIPMIDVIFFLLVFFMLFTTFRTTPTGIDMELPRAVTVSQQKDENIIIDIDRTGKIYYQGEILSATGLQQIATEKFAKNNQIVAIINADQNVMYKHIVAVMDNLRQVGIYRLALAAEKKE
ncbi:MAG: biopolymer transporter ExbD [Halanaerobiales bacterium]|nr:biopolymer transporter ExbD [Halanaerobiales bacterium]